MNATGFAIIIIVSMLDPIAVVGYLFAGLCIKRYWVAIVAALAWRMAFFLFLSFPGSSKEALPILIGAAIFTTIVYLIRNFFRRRSAYAEVERISQASPADPNTVSEERKSN
jgi:glucose-6-phosphate-specific signal transduction histidine kinase|tara:strand:- start:252 stop:587 length:336 start_codon:yes stop_codon:yes gene_type:complete